MAETPAGGSSETYTDFEIQLERLDDAGGRARYEVKAKCQGGTARHELRLPFEPDAVATIVHQIEQAVYFGRQPKLGRGVSVVDAVTTDGSEAPSKVSVEPTSIGTGTAVGADAVLAEFGHDLYRALFDGKVGRLFDKMSGKVERLRIRLSLNLADPYQRALSRMPWECIKEDPRPDLQFLSAIESSPFVRDVEIGEPLDKPKIEGALKILVITANPSGTDELGLVDEENVIHETFDDLERQGLVVVDKLRDASWEELSGHLNRNNDYHIIHYMGHGDYDAGTDDKPGRGGMLLLQGRAADGSKGELERVDADQLSLILKEKTPNVRLMFINACNTAVETKGGGDPFGGLATKILETGIPAVIAMQFMIEDNSAIRLARAFYSCISANKPVDHAVTYARQMELITKRQKQDKANHWLTPVLYMRAGEDGRLFAADEVAVDEPKLRGVPTAEAPAVDAQPELEPPPAWVAPDAEHAVWFTEWRNRLVLNWRVRGEPGYGDVVALFDGAPRYPFGWMGIQYEAARETRLFVTDKAPVPDRYHVAYLRHTSTGDYEIACSWGPYSREAAATGESEPTGEAAPAAAGGDSPQNGG